MGYYLPKDLPTYLMKSHSEQETRFCFSATYPPIGHLHTYPKPNTYLSMGYLKNT
jgi:hypothetical protein